MRACVLLSTYNGDKYLGVQLDSILGQRDCDIELLIRDDGSSDGTIAILQSYAACDRRVQVFVGQNLGVAKSFLWLVERAAAGADGYLFADQDDRWDPDKVASAVRLLQTKAHGFPALYCSRVRYVDAEGRYLGSSRIPPRVGLSNALVECVSVGCSMALNSEGLDLLKSAMPDRPIMHDWWCYLVLAALGRVIYDEHAKIDYRQHAANVLGAKPTRLGDWLLRLQRRVTRRTGVTLRSDQAAELLKLFNSELRGSNRTLIEEFVGGKTSLVRRLRLLARGSLGRGTWLDKVILNAQIILNDY